MRVVQPILSDIIEAGHMARSGDRKFVWRWRDKDYLGAAHGTAGIVLVLSHFLDELLDLRVDRQVINEVLLEGLQYRDGVRNIRSRPDSDREGLVHWCHGAPGWIAPTLRLLPDKVRGLGEVTWQRGLLATKGLGLCHGVCGNAYAFATVSTQSRRGVVMPCRVLRILRCSRVGPPLRARRSTAVAVRRCWWCV
eukprot:GEMP01079325.1.p1 GENE.GEMP01079325.1~~GEMP01079325.1.p1  ORF type:complete len:194 (+),score=18.83 GEMP01079325.1:364-945(+)